MIDLKENTLDPQVIRVSEPILSNGCRVEFSIEYPEPVGSFFKESCFYAEYGDYDLSNVPEHILMIPLLATLAPMAWALGVRLSVPSIDEEFRDSLEKIKGILAGLYPSVSWSGEIEADKVVKSGNGREHFHLGNDRNNRPSSDTGNFDGSRSSALLFSGGVDSVASFFNHLEERPLLVTIWGSDLSIRRSEAWEKASEINRGFAERYSTDIAFVKSNLRLFFDEALISDHLGLKWWEKVQYGLGQCGLCAPLSYICSLDRIYLASSRPKGCSYLRASYPEIINNIRWSGVSVVIDYEISRQDKIKLISPYLREDRELILRVCWKSGSGMNCSKCEKCLRTMVALAAEGINPNNHGFRFDRAALEYIKNEMEKGSLIETEGELLMWQDLQRSLPDNISGLDVDVEGLEDFLKWLRGMDFTDSSRFGIN